jgi:hypothetical protein
MSKNIQQFKGADWYACPSCGGEVRVGSSGCKACGPGIPEAWLQDDYLNGIDLPDKDSDFRYEEFVSREFGVASQIKPAHLSWKWWLVGITLVALLLAGSFL